MTYHNFHRLLMVICLIVILSVFSASAYAAYTLSLDTKDGAGNSKSTFSMGEDLYLYIMVSDLKGLAGCAFTLNYDYAMLMEPETDANGLPIDPTAITSLFPFTFVKTGHPDSGAITSRENSSVLGKIFFAGASIDTTTGGSKFTSSTPGSSFPLFIVRFRVLSLGTAGTYNFSLSQTILNNTAAGYAAEGETLPLLLGAVPNTDTANWNNLSSGAFPALSASLPAQVTYFNVVPSTGPCANLPVRIAIVSYNTFQDAYNTAVDGNTIQSHAVSFSENLNFNRNISVAIRGGYDCEFSTNVNKSVINGVVTISDGTIIIENLIIK